MFGLVKKQVASCLLKVVFAWKEMLTGNGTTHCKFCSRSTLRAHSHCAFFLIATAIPLIATNGLHGTQWKCSHYATVTTSPTPIQPIMSKSKSQSQIAQCERALNKLIFS